MIVRELTVYAQQMTPEMFSEQLGPFVLVQKPPEAAAQNASLALGAGRTIAIGNIAAMLDPLSFLKKFQELEVATIPPLSSEEALTIGRLPDCELVIDDPSVSKHHARIAWKSGASLAILEDLDSSNGTLLNGKKLAGPTVLKDNDLLAVGKVTLCFLFSNTLYTKLR